MITSIIKKLEQLFNKIKYISTQMSDADSQNLIKHIKHNFQAAKSLSQSSDAQKQLSEKYINDMLDGVMIMLVNAQYLIKCEGATNDAITYCFNKLKSIETQIEKEFYFSNLIDEQDSESNIQSVNDGDVHSLKPALVTSQTSILLEQSSHNEIKNDNVLSNENKNTLLIYHFENFKSIQDFNIKELILTNANLNDFQKKIFEDIGNRGILHSQFEKNAVRQDKIDEFLKIISSNINLDQVHFLSDKTIKLSKIKMKELEEYFTEKLNAILTFPNTVFASEFFASILAIRIVEVIRELNISAIDCFKYNVKRNKDIESDLNNLYHYSSNQMTTPKKRAKKSGMHIEDDNSPVFMASAYYGQLAPESYILEEKINTAKGSKSVQLEWNNDKKLHGHIFAAIKHFKKVKYKNFSLKLIQIAFKRRSYPSSMRSTFVPQVLYYLNEDKYLKETGNTVFDSSIGWLNRLTGSMLANQGNSFKSYVGTDPNPMIAKKAQELYLSLLKYNEKFHATFLTSPIEDLAVEEILACNNNEYFDLAITSPPFEPGLMVEKYAYLDSTEIKDKQSWVRYTTIDDYTRNFMVALLIKNIAILRAGGIFVLHFKNDVIVQLALNIVKNNHKEIEFNLFKKGKYYSGFCQESSKSARQFYENVYFFHRPNRVEPIPLLISNNSDQIEEIREEIPQEKGNKNNIVVNAVNSNQLFSSKPIKRKLSDFMPDDRESKKIPF